MLIKDHIFPLFCPPGVISFETSRKQHEDVQLLVFVSRHHQHPPARSYQVNRTPPLLLIYKGKVLNNGRRKNFTFGTCNGLTETWVQRKCVDKKLVMRWKAGRGKVDKERGDTGQGSWWWERSGNEAPSLERIRAGQFLFFPPSPWLASKGERCEVVSGKASKRGCSVKYSIFPLDHWTEWVNDTVGGFWPHYPLDGSSKPWIMLNLWLDRNLE